MVAKVLRTYFNPEGVLVTVYKPRAPRTGERTWPVIKGSIANMGSKSAGLIASGYKGRNSRG